MFSACERSPEAGGVPATASIITSVNARRIWSKNHDVRVDLSTESHLSMPNMKIWLGMVFGLLVACGEFSPTCAEVSPRA